MNILGLKKKPAILNPYGGNIVGKARNIAEIAEDAQKLGWKIPKSILIPTSWFERFVEDNGFGAETKMHRASNGVFSDQEGIESILEEFGDKPIAIRGASDFDETRMLRAPGLLSTEFYWPGKPNKGKYSEKDLIAVKKALTTVFGSYYSADVKAFRKKHGIVDGKIGAIVQEVVQKFDGAGRPGIGGYVNTMYNDYIIVGFAIGLGTRAVGSYIKYVAKYDLETSKVEWLQDPTDHVRRETTLQADFVQRGTNVLGDKRVFYDYLPPKDKLEEMVKRTVEHVMKLEERIGERGFGSDVEFAYSNHKDKHPYLLQCAPIQKIPPTIDFPRKRHPLASSKNVSGFGDKEFHEVFFLDGHRQGSYDALEKYNAVHDNYLLVTDMLAIGERGQLQYNMFSNAGGVVVNTLRNHDKVLRNDADHFSLLARCDDIMFMLTPDAIPTQETIDYKRLRMIVDLENQKGRVYGVK